MVVCGLSADERTAILGTASSGPTGYTLVGTAGGGENQGSVALAYKLDTAAGAENPSAFSGVSTTSNMINVTLAYS